MSGEVTKIRKSHYNILSVSLPIFALILFTWGVPSYKGSVLSFLIFGVIAVTYATTALVWRPSVFLSTAAFFLTLGFFIKLLALNTFGMDLIEPVGRFDSTTQWDSALGFASAGFLGAFMANYVSHFAPSTKSIALSRSSISAAARPFLGLLLAVLMIAAIVIYGINLRWNVLRIGYPLGINLPFPLYPILAFIITWGALIGALTLAWWLQDRDKAASPAVLYISGIIGFMASFTMGSRVQFLLYVFAGVLVIASRDGIKALFRLRILAALIFCGLLFGLSIAAVSLQRSFDFMPPIVTAGTHDASIGNDPTASASAIPIVTPPDNATPQPNASMKSPPTQAATSPSPNPAAAANEVPVGPTMSLRIQFIMHELKSLLIMRWVGLEGVMTTAGSYDHLGMSLFNKALREDPDMGTDGIYQHMSGDLYANVKNFVFLTLPGPIGVASYTGNFALIAAFVFFSMLLGQALELYCAKVTRNLGCTTAVGVSLAYLFVQMGFPWTIFIYCVELFLAISVIALVRLAIVKFPVNGVKTLPAQA